jgi:hypothetical protein
MPLSLTCPSCGARLRAPDRAAGRTIQCPKCKKPMAVQVVSPPVPSFPLESAAPPPLDDPDEAHDPFADEEPEEAPSEIDPTELTKKGRRSAPKKKPKPAGGFNPFDEVPAAEEPTTDPSKKRRYRKDGDYNPFGDVPIEEVPDPVGDGFDFGIEAPPTAPASEFDFGPQDHDDPRRQ